MHTCAPVFMTFVSSHPKSWEDFMAAPNCLWCHLQASFDQPQKHSRSRINKCTETSMWPLNKKLFSECSQQLQHDNQILYDLMPYSHILRRDLTKTKDRFLDWKTGSLCWYIQDKETSKVTCSIDSVLPRKLCFHHVQFTTQHRFRIMQSALLVRVHVLRNYPEKLSCVHNFWGKTQQLYVTSTKS